MHKNDMNVAYNLVYMYKIGQRGRKIDLPRRDSLSKKFSVSLNLLRIYYNNNDNNNNNNNNNIANNTWGGVRNGITRAIGLDQKAV